VVNKLVELAVSDGADFGRADDGCHVKFDAPPLQADGPIAMLRLQPSRDCRFDRCAGFDLRGTNRVLGIFATLRQLACSLRQLSGLGEARGWILAKINACTACATAHAECPGLLS